MIMPELTSKFPCRLHKSLEDAVLDQAFELGEGAIWESGGFLSWVHTLVQQDLVRLAGWGFTLTRGGVVRVVEMRMLDCEWENTEGHRQKVFGGHLKTYRKGYKQFDVKVVMTGVL